MIIFMAIMLAVIPIINRKSLLFGVRIPESVTDYPECRKLKQNYITLIAISSIILIGVVIIINATAPQYLILSLMYTPFIALALQFCAFIPQWKKATALKAKHGWDVPMTSVMDTRSAENRDKLSSIRWGWYVSAAIIVVVLISVCLYNYPNIPTKIVTHRDANGIANAFADKSVVAILQLPLVMLGIICIMILTNVFIYRQKLQISAEHPALSFAQHKMYRRMMSNALGILTICYSLMLSYFQLSDMYIINVSIRTIYIVLPIMFIGIAPSIYVTIKAGQSGCRLKPTISPEENLSEQLLSKVKFSHSGNSDDKFWKLGLFYYNPDDPAVLVEDRFSGSGGFNFARKPAQIGISIFILLLITVYVLTTYMLIVHPIIH